MNRSSESFKQFSNIENILSSIFEFFYVFVFLLILIITLQIRRHTIIVYGQKSTIVKVKIKKSKNYQEINIFSFARASMQLVCASGGEKINLFISFYDFSLRKNKIKCTSSSFVMYHQLR